MHTGLCNNRERQPVFPEVSQMNKHADAWRLYIHKRLPTKLESVSRSPQRSRAAMGTREEDDIEKAYQWLAAPETPRYSQLLALAYVILNCISATGIVFSNKVVFTTFGFTFTTTLTLIHTLFTLCGMRICLAAGMFVGKPLPQAELTPLALAYVAYIVLCNLSLNINTVGFYQVSLHVQQLIDTTKQSRPSMYDACTVISIETCRVCAAKLMSCHHSHTYVTQMLYPCRS